MTCYFLYACQFIVSDDTRLSSTFTTWITDWFPCPRHPTTPTSHTRPWYSHANIIPPPVRQDSDTRDWKRAQRLLCLHLPIRPHGKKNFFIFFFYIMTTRILRFFQIFQCICFYQEKETFCCKERGFGRRCKRAYLGGREGQGKTRARGHANLSC